MPSANEIARAALDKEEAPKREVIEQAKINAAEQKRRVAANQKKKDAARLDKSPLSEWFPGVGWKAIAHFRMGTVFESTEENERERIRLWVSEDSKTIKFTPHEDWLEDTGPFGNRDRGWDGPEVKSAADVGKELRHQDDIYRSMPAYLP